MAHALNWSPEAMRAAVAAVACAVRSGDLPADPGPCVVCGGRVNVDRHHFDYSKPLATISLCRSHHCAVHHGSIQEPVTGRWYPRDHLVGREMTVVALAACRIVERLGPVDDLAATIDAARDLPEPASLEEQRHRFRVAATVRRIVVKRGALRHVAPTKGALWVRTDLPLSQAFPLVFASEAA